MSAIFPPLPIASRAPPRPEELAKYRARLMKVARTRLFNPVHAEDAVQETLLAAIESLDSYSGGGSLYGWLKGILRHKIVDCVRRSARDQWQEMDGDGSPLNMDEIDAPGAAAWSGCGPECPVQALTRRRLLEALEDVIRELPERTAQVFMLREWAGFSTAEICSDLAVSETHCSVMVHRARNRIRERLDPEWAQT